MTGTEYRLWVSDDRCTLVRLWNNRTLEVCRRNEPDGIWGPPVTLAEEAL